MIPLIFIALLVSAGLTAYEFSPRAHAWMDAHARAFREALAAHRAAEDHVRDAHAALDQATAAVLASAAAALNRLAAEKTAVAADAAKTPEQRQAAAGSAAAVVDREKKIDDLFAKIGIGQCDARVYANVTPAVRDALIAKLHAEGMTVTGNNPWDIETHKYDVKLRAAWHPPSSLKLIVTAGKGGLFGMVTCDAIWAEIEPILKEVIGA